MTSFSSPRCTAPLFMFLCLSACSSAGRMAPDGVNGNTVRATLASQVLRPEAVRNADPVAGMDGAAAVQAQHKYEKSFSKPAADPSATLVQHR